MGEGISEKRGMPQKVTKENGWMAKGNNLSNIGEKAGTFFDKLLEQLKDMGGLGGNIAGELASDALEGVLGKIAKIGKVIFQHIEGKINDKHTGKTLEQELQNGDLGIGATELRNVLDAAIKEMNGNNSFIESRRGKFKRWLDVLYSFRSNDFLEYFSQVEEFQKLRPNQQRGLVEFLCEFRERLIDTQWAKIPEDLKVVHASLQSEISELKSLIQKMEEASPNGNAQPTLRRIAMLRECPNCGPGADMQYRSTEYMGKVMTEALVCTHCGYTVDLVAEEQKKLEERERQQIAREREELEILKSDLLCGFSDLLTKKCAADLIGAFQALIENAIINPSENGFDEDTCKWHLAAAEGISYSLKFMKPKGKSSVDAEIQNSMQKRIGTALNFFKHFILRTPWGLGTKRALEPNYLLLRRIGFECNCANITREQFVSFLIDCYRRHPVPSDCKLIQAYLKSYYFSGEFAQKRLAEIEAAKALPAPEQGREPFTYSNGILTDWDKTLLAGGVLELPEGTVRIADEVFANCDEIVSVSLPASLEAIGNGAFAFCKNLRKVEGGENVKIIGGRAFFGCRALGSYALPANLEELGGWAFCGCRALSNPLTLPASLRELGEGAFVDCPAKVDLAEGNKAFAKAKDCLFDKDFETLYLVCDRNIAVLWIGEMKDLVRIAAGAAYGCERLKFVEFPEGQSITVGACAFGHTSFDREKYNLPKVTFEEDAFASVEEEEYET